MGYVDTISEKKTIAQGLRPAVFCLPAAIVVAAVWIRFDILENADVAWLLTLAERWLNGRHDFIEVNPPGAILTYVPAVWLAKILGIPAEAMCDALVFVLAGVALGLAAIFLGQKFAARHNVPLFIAGAAAILLILPTYTFAEREHLSFILILPWIAVLAARAENNKPNVWLQLVAGFACGLCVVIKPHIVFAIAFAISVRILRIRSWRIIFTLENWVIALVVLLYGIILWTMFPEFFTKTLPLVNAVYVPARYDLPTLLCSAGSILWFSAVGLNLVIERSQRGGVFCDLLLACSFAGYLAFLFQGKGWPYHSYPAIAFAMLALVIRFARTDGITTTSDARLRFFEFAAAIFVFCFGAHWFDLETVHYDTRAVVQEIERIAPNPTMAMISNDISLGFPLVRLVHGVWAQRACSLWIVGNVAVQEIEDPDPIKIAKLAPYVSLARDTLIDDIRNNRPEILLVEDGGPQRFNWLAWAKADRRFAQVLLDYKFVERMGEAQIWRRR